MAGKTKAILIAAAVVVVLACAGGVAIYLKAQADNAVGKFSVSDYAAYTQKYGVLKADYVATADNAKQIAGAVWSSIYGKDANIRTPYKVSFDEANKVWLVQGALPKGQTGAVPNILIQQGDAKILAVWYDK
jgi:hypothetical protein